MNLRFMRTEQSNGCIVSRSIEIMTANAKDKFGSNVAHIVRVLDGKNVLSSQWAHNYTEATKIVKALYRAMTEDKERER